MKLWEALNLTWKEGTLEGHLITRSYLLEAFARSAGEVLEPLSTDTYKGATKVYYYAGVRKVIEPTPEEGVEESANEG